MTLKKTKLTLENIKWIRKINFSKKNNIIFEDSYSSAKELIIGRFFLDPDVVYVSCINNNYIFKSKKGFINFKFSKKVKVKIKNSEIYRDYGVNQKTKLIEYSSLENTIKTEMKFNLKN